ncbi:hypothetical protein IC582_013792 [Cucumis melo]
MIDEWFQTSTCALVCRLVFIQILPYGFELCVVCLNCQVSLPQCDEFFSKLVYVGVI